MEVDYFYEEGPAGEYVPILQDFVVENVVLTEGAPRSFVVKGYPTPGASVIKVSLNNVTLTGITESNHFIIEHATEVLAKDVYVNGELWTAPSNDGVISVPTFSVVFLLIIASVSRVWELIL